MTEHVVIGVDSGGTSTRCAVVTRDGRVLAQGRGGGGNQYSSADPGGAFVSALRAALADAGDVAVDGAVFGVSGAAVGHSRAVATVRGAWESLGLPGSPLVTDDIVVAFAAGSTADAGTVLIAGTGAVAAYVRDGAVARRCDGYGWLLGDEGSAVWIALAGLRAALASIDGRGRPTVLVERLAAALAIAPGDVHAIVRAAYARPPAELGGLAPEVVLAASGGDAVAGDIVAEAAERLLTNLAAVAPDPVGAEPVVLAGALLATGPVADAVHEGLRTRHGVAARTAGDGALGAAGLALRRTGAPASAHARLLAPAAAPGHHPK
ncbi:N-acetylglucosamine kinase-like BadF-type ATPase [Nocardiopsis mwathae]|uniref:N-acetylglucosamine kinase-like BadF-type ATPase n=1 Tax=Nocardiopsis mwathae TaxID=1472723 RepID=A0A7X0D3X9_9ACTN|nr:BadF/BadG/BcrA/BcrD ATPase family protein [Nocardiopsis mwathae]MBB6170480.1 N-acetylglucosamine kinase-like BadF-type ATPase [Nocardiopsis mwathae]